jgi:predicted peptidase
MQVTIKTITYTTALILFCAACRKDKPVIEQPKKAEFFETEPPVLTPVKEIINSTIGGFYSAVPVHYNDNSKKYPLLISIHGGGQFGNGAIDLPFLLNDGVPELLSEKRFPPNFRVDSQNFSFIVLAPQCSRYPATSEIWSFIDYAFQHYRIDSSRIYITGLSIGGTVAADLAAEYTSSIAAIVPMSGVSSTDSSVYQKCSNIVKGNLPVWIFQNTDDPLIGSFPAKTYFSILNSFNPTVPEKLTLFSSPVHDAWTRATDPAYKENGKNIYEWMLQFHR